MKKQKNLNVPSVRDRMARLRFSIVGCLFAAPPKKGELKASIDMLAAKLWRDPLTGLDEMYSAKSIERWYYEAKCAHNPVDELKNKQRFDVNTFPSMTPAAIATVARLYREHPNWTVQLNYDNMAEEIKGDGTIPSYPSVRRFMKANGMHRQANPVRDTVGALAARDHLDRFEVRSFEMDHVNALWHLDFHHGSIKVLNRKGEWVQPELMCVMDDRSRLVCHIQWYTNETAESLIHALGQAMMKRGTPRALMTDNGAAMVAEETTNGLARMGVLHQTTLPYSPYQNAKQEAFWGRIEGRMLAMLEGETNLDINKLNLSTQAWTEQEYHRAVHSELKMSPLDKFLAGPDASRPKPSALTLQEAFRVETKRKQRRSDGTVSIDGCRYEISSQFRHFEHIHLQYARWDMSRVAMVDPRGGNVLCYITPVDKSANASAKRKLLVPANINLTYVKPTEMSALMKRYLAEYNATGIPPAYIPTAEKD